MSFFTIMNGFIGIVGGQLDTEFHNFDKRIIFKPYLIEYSRAAMNET